MGRHVTLSGKQLRELLHYDPQTGNFTWRAGPLSGKKAGGISNGYVYIGIRGAVILAHRLAWLYLHDEWPDGVIDHMNRNKTDNRSANLRVVDVSTNNENRIELRSDNTSGFTGVTRYRGQWRARIWARGKEIRLGLFLTKEAAHAAYINAKNELHEGYIPTWQN